MDTDNTLYIYPMNETYVQLDGDRGMLMDIYDYMSYKVPNARWTKAYKEKMWDGMVHLLDSRGFRIYKGLVPYLISYAEKKKWNVQCELDFSNADPDFNAKEFCDSLNLTLKPYDFQLNAIQDAIENGRACYVSPTSSGKSLVIYCIVRYYLKKFQFSKKIILTEPTTRLVKQMLTEWKAYAPDFPIEKFVHSIHDGATKHTNLPIIISTWQALQDVQRKYFEQFGCIIADECHGVKAPELKKVFEKSTECKYRFGLTGSLDDTECHRFVIEGLTGPAQQLVETPELQDRGIQSKLKIHCMVLKYSDELRKAAASFTWQKEIDFIVHHQKRTDFIAKLVASRPEKENILVLTDFHDKKPHVRLLKEAIQKVCPNKKIIEVHGKTKEDSEEVRRYMETHEGVVLIATFGVFSTGVSINNIQTMIFATFGKSMIKVLQSIGRGLRRDGKENKINAFDLVDDLTYNGERNHLVKHFIERVKIYLKEKHEYITYNIKI